MCTQIPESQLPFEVRYGYEPLRESYENLRFCVAVSFFVSALGIVALFGNWGSTMGMRVEVNYTLIANKTTLTGATSIGLDYRGSLLPLIVCQSLLTFAIYHFVHHLETCRDHLDCLTAKEKHHMRMHAVVVVWFIVIAIVFPWFGDIPDFLEVNGYVVSLVVTINKIVLGVMLICLVSSFANVVNSVFLAEDVPGINEPLLSHHKV